MRSSYLSLAFCSVLAVASPVEKRGSALPQLPPYLQETFPSTGKQITIFYFPENPNQVSHSGTQVKPGVWIASNTHPVCLSYCLSPAFAAADPQRYAKNCLAGYCTTTIYANAVYVENDAVTSFSGANLQPCGDNCVGVVGAGGAVTPISIAA